MVFLLYLFDYFFPIFCYTCQNFKNVCYTVFSYTRRFSNGMVIHFCYTWLFIKIFVIPVFVIPNFRYNKMKAKIDKIEDKKIDRVCYKRENYNIFFTISDLSASFGFSNWYGSWFDRVSRHKEKIWFLSTVCYTYGVIFFVIPFCYYILEYLENHCSYLCLLYLGSRYNQNLGITKNSR